MAHILRILSAIALLSAAVAVRADPLPIEGPGEGSPGLSPVRGLEQRRSPRRGVRKDRRPVERSEDTDEGAAPAPAPASMPSDLSAPPHIPDERETSLV